MKIENGQEQEKSVGDLLRCAICDASDLHPEMARVLSFQTISKKIGRRVLPEDLAAFAFCKHHDRTVREMLREEGENEWTFEYTYAIKRLQERMQADEDEDKERAAVEAFVHRVHVRVVDEEGDGRSKRKERQQKGEKRYNYMSASMRDRDNNDS